MRRAAPRLEKFEQADGVRLLLSLGARVYVSGTRRARGDYQGTRQTPGIPDVEAFLPARAGRCAQLVKWEVKRAGGRLRPEQAAYRDACEAAGVAHVVGDLNALLRWLVAHGYLRADQVPHDRLGVS